MTDLSVLRQPLLVHGIGHDEEGLVGEVEYVLQQIQYFLRHRPVCFQAAGTEARLNVFRFNYRVFRSASIQHQPAYHLEEPVGLEVELPGVVSWKETLIVQKKVDKGTVVALEGGEPNR